MRIGIFSEPGTPPVRYELGRVAALEATGWQTFQADDLPRLNVPDDIDVAVVYLKFRTLAASQPIDWGGFTGLKLMLEQDAVQNYVILEPNLLGTFPPVFHRHGFDRMLVTSEYVAERLEADGVPTFWTPEAIDPERFRPLGEERSGLAFYGSPYAARLVMLRRIEKARIELTRFKTDMAGLNAALNRYSGIVICNKGLTRVPSRIERLLKHVPPLLPGQVFAKNFEVAAAGCAPICDVVEPDLRRLGFVHGETALIYSTFDELIDTLRSTDEDRLRAIGTAAAELCRERHTWTHRAAELNAGIAAMASAGA